MSHDKMRREPKTQTPVCRSHILPDFAYREALAYPRQSTPVLPPFFAELALAAVAAEELT